MENPPANKRRRTTISSSEAAEEGAYTAVLKGRNSLQFQHKFNNNKTFSVDLDDPNLRVSGFTINPGVSSVSDKLCPCGIAYCVVFTAKTDKNFGRKFYKCPKGCGFFEWCDKESRIDNMAIKRQDHNLNSSVPELSCPCGAGSCLILTAKTGKNVGQQFYRCPAIQGGCGFFKWCNDDIVKAGLSDSNNISKVHRNTNEASNMNNGTIGSSSCFKCGKNGHWAKDCSQASFDSPVEVGLSDSHNITKVPQNTNEASNINHGAIGGSSCFKCGKGGHWASNCSQASFDAPVKVGLSDSHNITPVPRSTHEASNINHGVRGGSGSSCFKCGKDGHWARDCSRESFASSETHSSGTCFKCGTQGHWAKDCCSKI